MNEILLNFLPLEEQDFTFTVYRKEYAKGDAKPKDGIIRKYTLPLDDDPDERQEYWVSFEPIEGYTQYTCTQDANVHIATLYLLREIDRCVKSIQGETDFKCDTFAKEVYYVYEPCGVYSKVFVIKPYYLGSLSQYGFIVSYRIKFKDSEKHTKIKDHVKLQKDSLSLDKHGRSNKNYYLDHLNYIRKFVSDICPNINTNLHALQISTMLQSVNTFFLQKKIYLFDGKKQSFSQYKGLSEHGPLEAPKHSCDITFLFRKHQIELARDLYRALIGTSYSTTFSGMEKVFGVRFSKENVQHRIVDNLEGEIDGIISQSNRDHRMIVFLADDEESKDYVLLKHRCLQNNVPCQVVTCDLIKSKNSLKWAVGSIGLQIFAKMGGKPWIVQPSNDNCLIIGVGQAHQRDTHGAITKYFAYSVLTESSGLFKNIDVLANTDNYEAYLDGLGDAVCSILRNYKNAYDKFVIHAPFKIKMDGIRKIRDSFENEELSGKEMCVLKINTNNAFMGFLASKNCKVPYESTTAYLSSSECLVWFEGLQFGSEIVHNRISGPTHIQFCYEYPQFSHQKKQLYLQDALNLSGANWRGFNAKSIPVSIHYCRLVAKFVKNFAERELPMPELNKLDPWFL